MNYATQSRKLIIFYSYISAKIKDKYMLAKTFQVFIFRQKYVLQNSEFGFPFHAKNMLVQTIKLTVEYG